MAISAGEIDPSLHRLRADVTPDLACTSFDRNWDRRPPLRWLATLVAPHRDGNQAQVIFRPVIEPGGAADPRLCAGLAAVSARERLSVDVLASDVGMSRRNFKPLQEVTGATPARWVLARRLDEARRLLETTEWSITKHRS